MYGPSMRVLAALWLVSGVLSQCTLEELAKCYSASSNLASTQTTDMFRKIDRAQLSKMCGSLPDLKKCSLSASKVCPENLKKLLGSTSDGFEYICNSQTEYLTTQRCFTSKPSLMSAALECYTKHAPHGIARALAHLLDLDKNDHSKVCKYMKHTSSCVQREMTHWCPEASKWYKTYDEMGTVPISQFLECETKSKNWKMIVGGVVGGVAVLIIISLLAASWFMYRRRAKTADTTLILDADTLAEEWTGDEPSDDGHRCLREALPWSVQPSQAPRANPQAGIRRPTHII